VSSFCFIDANRSIVRADEKLQCLSNPKIGRRRILNGGATVHSPMTLLTSEPGYGPPLSLRKSLELSRPICYAEDSSCWIGVVNSQFPVDPLQFVALFLGQNKDVASADPLPTT
jgi:hypothetical protein